MVNGHDNFDLRSGTCGTESLQQKCSKQAEIVRPRSVMLKMTRGKSGPPLVTVVELWMVGSGGGGGGGGGLL